MIRCVIYSDVLKNFDSVVMMTKFTRVLILVSIVSNTCDQPDYRFCITNYASLSSRPRKGTNYLPGRSGTKFSQILVLSNFFGSRQRTFLKNVSTGNLVAGNGVF